MSVLDSRIGLILVSDMNIATGQFVDSFVRYNSTGLRHYFAIRINKEDVIDFCNQGNYNEMIREDNIYDVYVTLDSIWKKIQSIKEESDVCCVYLDGYENLLDGKMNICEFTQLCKDAEIYVEISSSISPKKILYFNTHISKILELMNPSLLLPEITDVGYMARNVITNEYEFITNIDGNHQLNKKVQ